MSLHLFHCCPCQCSFQRLQRSIFCVVRQYSTGESSQNFERQLVSIYPVHRTYVNRPQSLFALVSVFCYYIHHIEFLYSSVSQPPGRGPVPDPGVNYIGPREILLELITNFNVILYLTRHTIHIIVQLYSL